MRCYCRCYLPCVMLLLLLFLPLVAALRHVSRTELNSRLSRGLPTPSLSWPRPQPSSPAARLATPQGALPARGRVPAPPLTRPPPCARAAASRCGRLLLACYCWPWTWPWPSGRACVYVCCACVQCVCACSVCGRAHLRPRRRCRSARCTLLLHLCYSNVQLL